MGVGKLLFVYAVSCDSNILYYQQGPRPGLLIQLGFIFLLGSSLDNPPVRIQLPPKAARDEMSRCWKGGAPRHTCLCVLSTYRPEHRRFEASLPGLSYFTMVKVH